MNWQPIETAPKDGTKILGWNGSRFCLCQWDEQPYHKHPLPYWDLGMKLGPAFDRSSQPTHWMPLPPPPTTEQSSAVPLDDDLDEPLGPACSIDNPECESCQ